MSHDAIIGIHHGCGGHVYLRMSWPLRWPKYERSCDGCISKPWERGRDIKLCSEGRGARGKEGVAMAKMKIEIRKSPTADTRSCDFAKVSKQTLYDSSVQHIHDVCLGIELFRVLLGEAATRHDFDKLSAIDAFHADFVTGFAQTGWWDNHRKVNRHHLLQEDGVPADVNLIDVLDMVADCVMAGMARTGEVYALNISPEVLMRAFENTVTLLKESVEVVKDEAAEEARKK